jgi:hypothetical protein
MLQKIGLKSLKRINVKIDLSFFTIIPYKETLNYIIDGKGYRPVSYRFLCFAVIIVTTYDEVKYDIDKNLERVFK